MEEPVEESQNPGSKHTVQDDRTGNGEDFGTDAEDLPFLFVFDSGRSNAIGKTGDGHQGTGSAKFYQFLVNVKTCT